MKYKRRRIGLGILSILIGGFLIVSGYKLIKDNEIKKEKNAKIAEGVIKLKALEAKDISQIESEVKNINNKNTLNENPTVNNGDLKEIFNGTVFMGDSLTEPLSFYNILDEDSVLGIKGRDVIKAKKNDLGTLKSLNPKKIVMMYGMNDLLLFNNSKEFRKNYESLINEVKEELPNVEIYINSVFPVTNKAIAKEQGLSKVNDFNNELKEMCNANNIKFIDTTSMVKEDFYEPDGVHMKANFYTPWLKVIKTEVGL